jgi:hypothetical protein
MAKQIQNEHRKIDSGVPTHSPLHRGFEQVGYVPKDSSESKTPRPCKNTDIVNALQVHPGFSLQMVSIRLPLM